MAYRMRFAFKLVENKAEKEENAVNQHFLLFPLCFQKLSSVRLLNSETVWLTVLTFHTTNSDFRNSF